MPTTDKQGILSNKSRMNVLTTLALLSGCCGLAYEVLYVRALTAILGDMFYVHAALLSTFLLGIGLGAKLAHKWLRWLWAFEISTGLYAIILPSVLKWLSQQIVLSVITSSPTLTILATMAFISIPSLLIGFSIPLYSAYVKTLQRKRLAFQGIYKMYNLGAFLSIIGVEFVLIRCFGIRLSLAIVGAINLFNGIILILMKITPASKPTENPRRFLKRVILALGMASLCSAVFQMFFLKLSYLVFHPHRENFAIGLSITMLGIFFGTWLVSRVSIKFETLLILITVLIAFIYVNYLPLVRLFEATISLARSHGVLIFAHKFIFGCLFALAPMILFGALIPSLMRTEREVAGESGHLLWISSLANAIGYIVYVSIGHPVLTSGALLALIAGIMVLASLLAAGFRWSKIHAALAATGILLAVILISNWKERNFYLAHWVNKLRPEDKVTVFKSGAESATLVNSKRAFKSGSRASGLARENEDKDTDIWQDVWISYNGHPSITVQRNGVVNYAEILVGVIPALNASSPDRALVIGLGTGVTAGATSQVFKTTDVVEINNAFYKMMPALSYANLDIQHNASANLYLSDGRAFLVGKNETYDAILNTVSAPTYFSASKIYTVDFYDRVRRALKPDGVFCTWISAADMSEEGMMTILSALRHSFRYCELRLLRAQYYLLTCSNQPIYARRQFSELQPDKHRLTKQLQRGLSILDLDAFFEDIVLTENLFDHFTPDVPRENTDDHPVLEFLVVRDFQLGTMGSDPFGENQALLNIDPLQQDKFVDFERFAHRAATFWMLGSKFFDDFKPTLMKDPNVAYEFFLQTSEHNIIKGELDEAAQSLMTSLHIKPGSAQAHNTLGEVRQSQGKMDIAIANYRKAVQIKPDFIEAYNNLGNVLIEQGKLDQAIQVFRDALAQNESSDSMSNTGNVHYSLGLAFQKAARVKQAKKEFNRAVEEFSKLLTKEPHSVETLVRLGDTFTSKGDFKQAVYYYSKALSMDETILSNHYKLIKALESAGQLEPAIQATRKAIELFSQNSPPETVIRLEKHLEMLKSAISEPRKQAG